MWLLLSVHILIYPFSVSLKLSLPILILKFNWLWNIRWPMIWNWRKWAQTSRKCWILRFTCRFILRIKYQGEENVVIPNKVIHRHSNEIMNFNFQQSYVMQNLFQFQVNAIFYFHRCRIQCESMRRCYSMRYEIQYNCIGERSLFPFERNDWNTKHFSKHNKIHIFFYYYFAF